MGENIQGGPTEDDGSGFGLRGGYAAGPFNVAIAYAKTNFAAGDFETWNIGGQWDFGVAKLIGQYASNELSGGTALNLDGKGWLIGGLIPVGAGEIRLSYSAYETDARLGVATTNPEVTKYAIGYVHNLSKRTALYATFAHLSNDGGASQALNGAVGAVNASSTGYDFGIRHSF